MQQIVQKSWMRMWCSFCTQDTEDEGWRLLQSLELPGTAEGSEREWLPLQVGLYYEWQEVNCGDVAFDNNELVKAIIENKEDPEKQHLLREKRIEQYLTYENENSCVLPHTLQGFIDIVTD